MIDAVYWYIQEQEMQGVLSASDKSRLWSNINKVHGEQKVSEYLKNGRILTIKSQEVDLQIQSYWAGGAYSVLQPQYYSAPLSIDVLRLLA